MERSNTKALSVVVTLLLAACSEASEPQPTMARSRDAASPRQATCPAPVIPLVEIENTTFTPLILDEGVYVFLPNGRYRFRGGWGGSEEGLYRVCGADLCITPKDGSESCRTLRRMSKGRYLDPSDQEMVFEPITKKREPS